MSESYDYERLWDKAQLFLNRAMDETESRDFNERALWASFALELLAKAALARHSPLLIADPHQDDRGLLVASGLLDSDQTGKEKHFKSIRASTLYARCGRAFGKFNEKKATQISHARNEYLHGGSPKFCSIPDHAWWPSYWQLASTLITAMDKEISDLVGSELAQVAERYLLRNEEIIKFRTDNLIERARQRVEQYQAGNLPLRVAGSWRPGVDRSAGLKYCDHVDCPACENEGKLEGEETNDVEVTYEEYSPGEFWPEITIDVVSEYFSCPSCGLVLDDFELISEAGLIEVFATEGDADDIPDHFGDYGND